jgi:hypothetical protein
MGAVSGVGTVLVGVDVGQRVDPTAIAVAEIERRGRDDHYLIRHLERLPLGTSYPAVADRVAAVVAGIAARTGRRPSVYVDATGVGKPLVDALTTKGMRGAVYGCYFNHGDRRTVEGREVKIGKGWLVGQLQVLLQSGRIHLPQTAKAAALAEELLNYEIRVSENAGDTYGAFKVGTHDDLVTALGLAAQPLPPRWGVAA